MTTGERLRRCREQRGYTLVEVGEHIGVRDATIQRYESGNIKTLKQSTIAKFAELYNVSPGYLMGWEDEPQKSIFTIPGIIPVPEMRKVPLIGSIACGVPILAEENIEDYINMPGGVRADYCLHCKGDSMTGARIFDGDIVFIRQQEDVENGEIAAVLIEGEATLKRVYKAEGHLTLLADNQTFPPLSYSGEALAEVRIIGKAIAFLSNVK